MYLNDAFKCSKIPRSIQKATPAFVLAAKWRKGQISKWISVSSECHWWVFSIFKGWIFQEWARKSLPLPHLQYIHANVLQNNVPWLARTTWFYYVELRLNLFGNAIRPNECSLHRRTFIPKINIVASTSNIEPLSHLRRISDLRKSQLHLTFRCNFQFI